MTVVAVYVPPTHKPEAESLITFASQQIISGAPKVQLVVAGDFNREKPTFLPLRLKQAQPKYKHFFTRIQGGVKSTLDHIFTNNSLDLICKFISYFGVT